MQLYALDQDGKPIFASHALKGVDYSCCECHESVRLREGPHRRAHFYHHQPSSACRQNGKSLIHLQIQSHFQELLSTGTCVLERIFPSIGRIADVVWVEEKIVFEIQCSPISATEVMERNRDYAQEGYQVIWILHDQRYNKRKATAAEIWLQGHPHYFSDFNEKQGIFYDQYSSLEKGCRHERSAKVVINPTKILRNLSEKGSVREKWLLHVTEDLMDKGELPQRAFREMENSFHLWSRLRYFYRIFFRHLLEKCC